jgi:AAA15 family ATPase/GTPase
MIKSVNLNNFMNYENFSSEKFSGINVFIGKNDTGKTGLLKLLYASAKSVEEFSLKSRTNDPVLKKILAEKLQNTFQPGKKGLGELVRKPVKDKLITDIEFRHPWTNYSDRLHFSFGESTTTTITDCQDKISELDSKCKVLFVPAKEVLTALKAIRATRDNLHMTGFDDTYLDLIRSLVLPPVSGKTTFELKDVKSKLEDLFEGHIEPDSDDDFVFVKNRNQFPMQLTAEGIKKIGILHVLIRNRQLSQNSILFMDEPETALHPSAIRELAEMLMLMSKAGVQIFLATHSYFMLKQLHLSSRQFEVDSLCYELRQSQSGIVSQRHDLRTSIPENEISEEAIKMADQQLDLDLNS